MSVLRKIVLGYLTPAEVYVAAKLVPDITPPEMTPQACAQDLATIGWLDGIKFICEMPQRTCEKLYGDEVLAAAIRADQPEIIKWAWPGNGWLLWKLRLQESSFSAAVEHDKTDLMAKLIEDQYPDQIVGNVFKEMQTAASSGSINAIQWLIRWLRRKKKTVGFDCMRKVSEAAASNGHMPILRWLREEEELYVRAAFSSAAKSGQLTTLREVKQWLGDERWYGSNENNDALRAAAEGNQKEAVLLLLEWGATSIDCALVCACSHNACDVIRLLLDTQQISNTGICDSLINAAIHGAVDALKIMYGQYCDRLRTDAVFATKQPPDYVLTEIFIYSVKNGQCECAAIVRSWHPTVNLEHGLCQAARFGKLRMMEALKDMGAIDFDAALLEAAVHDRPDAIEMAVQLGATKIATTLRRIHDRGHHSSEGMLISILADREQ